MTSTTASSSTTAFYSNERCFWHSGGNYAALVPVGGLVQPLATGGLPENPETKRRLKNLMHVTGLMDELASLTAPPASDDDILRVHDASYIEKFKTLSADDGGELGQRTPFGPGGYDIAALSAGLVKAAVNDVLAGTYKNAYALSRPPGHHCLPDYPMGFCLLANIAIAIEAALAARQVKRIAVVDWDVHHGNGTEAIFLDRADVLTLSLHQDNNYPLASGGRDVRGTGAGEGCNVNIPLPQGGGHDLYLQAMDTIVLPALQHFKPDLIVVACGFDASGVDPLSRMMAHAETFGTMTTQLMSAADDLCAGRLVMTHEGGYSEVHVPFCGHAVMQALSGSAINAPDPLKTRIHSQQPTGDLAAFHRAQVDKLAAYFASA